MEAVLTRRRNFVAEIPLLGRIGRDVSVSDCNWVPWADQPRTLDVHRSLQNLIL